MLQSSLPFALSLSARRAAGLLALAGAGLALTLAIATPPAPPAIERGGFAKTSGPPLSFVANRGQIDARVRYYAQARGFGAYFTTDGVTIALTKGERGHAVQLRFVGGRPGARPEALDRRAGRVNYIGGSERHVNIPTYGRVAYQDVWPGIDLVFIGRPGRLKYEFHLAAGADPADVRLAYAGSESLAITKDGGLTVRTPAGTLADAPPRSYQAGRGAVGSRFRLHGGHAYGFTLGAYDRDRPLVIDPGLEYSTFLGGTINDEVRDIAVDAQGNALVTGETHGPGFPTTPGAFDPTEGGGIDAFVAKLSADGSTLVYSTFLAGFESDTGHGIAVDDAGHAYVSGSTGSADFPTTPGAFDRQHAPGFFADVFVTKLNTSGSGLVYSTLLGGESREDFDHGLDIALDDAGHAYVTGRAESADFPTTPGAFDTTLEGAADAFATKLNPDGTGLVFSTLLGGSNFVIEQAFGIAVDNEGSAYLGGRTHSADFPTTPGALDETMNGQSDGFVTKLAPTGQALEYSTFLGGTGEVPGPDDDYVEAVAVDADGSAFVVGATVSPDFPTSPGAFDTTHNGGEHDAFVTKLDPSGGALAYSSFLGGADLDSALGIAVDARGRAWTAGRTDSSDFPTTPQGHDTSLNGFRDAFGARLNASGSALGYATYLGGTDGSEVATGVALDPAGDAYLGGITSAADFPTTPGAFDTSFNSPTRPDGFIAKLRAVAGAPASLTISPETAVNPLDEGQHCVSAAVRDAAGEPTPGVLVSFSVSDATSASGSATTDAGGGAGFCYEAPELPGSDQITATAEPNGPSGSATKTWVAPESTDGCRVSGGGHIRAANGDRATFSGNPRADSATEASGHVRYRDHGPAERFSLRSTAIDGVTCEGRRATIFGRAGSLVFRVELEDDGAGRRDTYGIVVSSGYDSGPQKLIGGNVNVRG